eukprot:746581-Rhodomonas_salina.1
MAEGGQGSAYQAPADPRPITVSGPAAPWALRAPLKLLHSVPPGFIHQLDAQPPIWPGSVLQCCPLSSTLYHWLMSELAQPSSDPRQSRPLVPACSLHVIL